MTFFRFEGKASRGEYFSHLLLGVVVYVGIVVIAAVAVSDGPKWVRSSVAIFYLLALFVIVADEVSVTVRRLHDLGRPTSHYWLLLIPLYNIYLSLLLLFESGVGDPEEPDDQPVDVQPQPIPAPSSDKYACSRCGGAITWGEPFCRHCGDRLEYD